MAFCIECGTKVPDIAKFCPQCGTGVIDAETVQTQKVEVPEVEVQNLEPAVPPAVETADAVIQTSESQVEDPLAPETLVSEPIATEAMDDPAPSVENSLAATPETVAETIIETPKSKAGLFFGLAALALVAAGGGAYGLGLFGGAENDIENRAAAPALSAPSPKPTVETVKAATVNPVNKAYSAAISTGRISDLGKFARTYPESSLAKDAEVAAFASLKRQSSVLAFKAFNEQFPNADTSSYTGPRTNADVDTATETISEDPPAVSENETPQVVSLLRYTITSRAEELEPFIEQGNIDYALSVIDEMLGWTDLTEDEATFLLNMRAKAETAPKLRIQEAAAIVPSYDTPAQPIERFGAITPDEAVEPGECDMEFSVDTSGALINIVPSCTQDIFIEPAMEAVSEWSYSPASLNGKPVQQDGLTVKVRFHLE